MPESRMRVVADTNIIVSGLFWHGTPRQVLDAARARVIDLYTSPLLLAELSDVLQRDKFAERLASVGAHIEDLVMGYAALAKVIKPTTPVSAISADPDDNAVLECAIAARADAIVSGDRHLLSLTHFRKIPILTANKLLARIPKANP